MKETVLSLFCAELAHNREVLEVAFSNKIPLSSLDTIVESAQQFITKTAGVRLSGHHDNCTNK